MKTAIKLRDDNGRIIGTAREEVIPSPTRVLVRFSLAMFALWAVLSWLL